MKVMKQKLFILFALLITTMTASATAGFDLTVGTSPLGSITFKVGDNARTYADEGEVVTVIVTPNSGCIVNEVSGQWYAAMAKTRGVDMLNKVTLTFVSEDATTKAKTYTFTMQRAHVEISSTYKILANTPWIQLDNNGFTYDGTEKKPTVTLKYNETTIPSTEYTVAYTNNVNVPANSDNANAPTVTVTIKESCQDYAGSAKAYFAISPAELTALTLNVTELSYAYKELTVEVASVKAGELTVPADGYDLSGNKGTDVGEYEAVVNGKGNFMGTATAAWVIKENEPKIDVDATETTDNPEKEGKDVDDVKMEMAVAENAATEAHTETREIVNPETGATETVEVTVIPVVLESISIPATATAEEITVTVPSEIRNGNVVYQVTEIKADAFKQAEGSTQKVTKIILPETEEPLKIAEGALKPDGELLEVVTPLALLDDYATTETMQENFEAKKVSAIATPKNKYWTFSSGVDCTLPEGVSAYIVTYENGQIRIVALEEANSSRIIKANNGVLLACDNNKGGDNYTFTANPGNQPSGATIAKTDANSYEGNCLVPVIENMHFDANYMILKNNLFYEIDPTINTKVPACKAVLNKAKGH